ncbi:DNA cytosine methyltransferase [Mesorhizobium sp. ESP-6-2]|uniref:DNA cytosine methyltransferase n=1 Tax=Mesorhizobium sp. ESP-6-2 TaxID=2876625 RepID=UPI001CCF7D67|nr:DNA cytosine methyltransferase [Mesorhizobium sp. ESP-6-2]MBZ9806954.1 DNA cytosine methyltransferase [Mesorhizobium sp. ESP-6-2]
MTTDNKGTRGTSASNAVVSLFSGAGGMSLGFAAAGLKPNLAADINSDACDTYRANLGEAIRCVDLSEPQSAFEAELAQFVRPFLLIGGPPCQGFSSAGAKRGEDERNRLIFNYFDIVQRLEPRWFLFENVEGLLTSNMGRSVFELVKQFIAIGYRVRLEKVNFAGFGLPQARKRVVLLGNAMGVDFDLPSMTHAFDAGKHRGGHGLPSAPSFDDATLGLGEPDSLDFTAYAATAPLSPYDASMRAKNPRGGTSLHNAVSLSNKLRGAVRHLKPGQTMKDLPEDLWHDSFKRRANRRVMDGTPTEKRGGAPSGVKRLMGNLNSLTITGAATREFIHPDRDRTITLREAARLQSFPDVYEFVGNGLSVAQQIGNAFPPLAAEVFARHLMKLDGSFGSGGKAPKQAGPGLCGYHLTDAIAMSPALAQTDAYLSGLMTVQQSLFFDDEPRKVAGGRR